MTKTSLEWMICELCGRKWFYEVVSRNDLPDFCKQCKAAYLRTQREAAND